MEVIRNMQQEKGENSLETYKRKRPLRDTTNINDLDTIMDEPSRKISDVMRLPTDSTEILELLRWLIPTRDSGVPAVEVERLLDDLCWLLPSSFVTNFHSEGEYLDDNFSSNLDDEAKEICNANFLVESVVETSEHKVPSGEEGGTCYVNETKRCFNKEWKYNDKYEEIKTKNKIITKQTLPVNTPRKKGSLSCNICNKYFASRETLRNHQLLHSGKRPHKCKICLKSFTTATGLRSHKYSHSEIRPFSCPTCDKAFKTQAVLTKHQETHLGEKKYSCEVCLKGFKTVAGLEYHRLIHKGEKAYPCGFCDRSFRTPSSYNQHQRSYHNGAELILKQEH